MPYFHCRSCHHEFEASAPVACNWCNTDQPVQFEERTPLEKLMRTIEACQRIDHARVEGTHLCRCGHVWYRYRTQEEESEGRHRSRARLARFMRRAHR